MSESPTVLEALGVGVDLKKARRQRQVAPIETDRLPPHSIENEQGVLGCGISSPDTLAQIVPAIRRKDRFYDLRHQVIFAALAQMHRAQQPIDLITLQEWLRQAGQLEQVGGIPYLSQLQDTVPSTANLPAYLEIVAEKFELRKILQTCGTIVSRIFDNTSQVAELKTLVQAELAEVFSGHANGDLPELIDAAAFIACLIEPPAELVEGILHLASKLVFGGSSKSFKTWCLLDLAVSIATGTNWLGRRTSLGKVLFVNFEIQPHAWQRRLAAVASAKSVEIRPGAITLWNLRGYAADFRQLIPKIIERCRSEKFALIILDPIYKLYGGTDENAAGDVAELLNSLENLAVETGAAIAFGAHFAKGNASAKEAIDRISGSGVFARDPDSLLIFTKHETEDAFTVEPILRNFAPIAPFAVRWEFPLMHRADDLDPSKLKQAGGRKPAHSPGDLLELLPSGGLENKEWMEKADENGISRRTFFRLRKVLEKDGKILDSIATGKWQPILQK